MAGARVSPTAHYTSYVWFAHGLSDPALATGLGRALYLALAPMNRAYARLARRPNLEDMLLARHRAIDERLAEAVAAGRVAQVVEIAAGLSPRGLRFVRRFPDLVYLEGDLPAMARRKRAALAAAGLADPRLRVVAIDALAAAGPACLPAVAAEHLDLRRPTALVAEGLVSYLDRGALAALWTGFARLLRGAGGGVYLGDINLRDELAGMRAALAFRALLQAFTRGRVHLHFRTPAEAEAALRAAGFERVRLHHPSELVRVIEAWA